MSISSVNLSSNTIGIPSGQGQVSFDPKNPLTTLQRKEDSVVTQLSAFGQVKASLADLQNKAQALKTFSKPPTFSDFQLVVQGFVQSFNSLNKNVSALTSKQGALNADNRSGQALSDVRKAVAGADQSGLSSLQKMGVSQQTNGTFSINQKQMEKTFQDNRPGALATIFELSNRVTQTVDKQISANGFIGKKVNDLSVRVNQLENTRSTAQNYLNTQKNSQQFMAFSSIGGYAARSAVANYTSIASL